jgi:hypothetical protein
MAVRRPGAGYMDVRRGRSPLLEPHVTGWMAHKPPFAFAERDWNTRTTHSLF